MACAWRCVETIAVRHVASAERRAAWSAERCAADSDMVIAVITTLFHAHQVLVNQALPPACRDRARLEPGRAAAGFEREVPLVAQIF